MKTLFLLLLIFVSGWTANLDLLLKKYQKASELSQITKIDTAGFVHIFTRDEIEKMQAYSLKDILSLIPGLNFVYTPNYTPLFTIASGSYLPQTAIRLYINDHDLTSSSFGSAMLIWGEMPVELFDHIEIYKAASSIEFGSETGLLIIKCYTKLAQREEGSKLRTTFDTHSSTSLDGYNAHTLDNHAFFIYAQGQNYKSKTTYRDGFTINRNKNDFFFYANYKNDSFTLQSGYINLSRDPFLGNGKLYHPTGGGLDAHHTFIDLTTKIANTHLLFSFDQLTYDRVYRDRDGTYIYNPNRVQYVQNYDINYKDTIIGIQAKKRWRIGNLSLIAGGLYKHKIYHEKGRFDTKTNTTHNRLDLFSIYIEGRYDIDPSLQLFLMSKSDQYSYGTTIPNKQKETIKTGFIKSYKQFKFKTFLQKSYLPVEFFKLYLTNNLPIKANPRLKFPTLTLATVESSYALKKQKFTLRFGKQRTKNKILFDSQQQTFINSKKTATFYFYEFDYQYNFTENDKVFLTVTKYFNNKGIYSPDTMVFLRFFNTIDKLEIYNEIIYKNGFTYTNKRDYDSSIDYFAALKYHITPDLSIGIRGENILNKGFKQPYRKTIEAYPIFEHRFIANLEWTF